MLGGCTTTMIAGLATGPAGAAAAQSAGNSDSSRHRDDGSGQADFDHGEIITTEEAADAADAIDTNGAGAIAKAEYADCRGAWRAHARRASSICAHAR
jgi:hypothetical protein